MTEREQLMLVRSDGLMIKCIKDPSEKVQKRAVQQNGYAIQYIKNPSKKNSVDGCETKCMVSSIY